jgi:predicted AlkP superfamily pyrophosphatase or phosphodiesterase
VATADRAVGQIIEAAERAGILERTAFIVTGDHGFFDVHTRVAPNVWLAEAGLLEARGDRGDWRATFHTAGGSAFLQLRRPGDTRTVERVRAILDGLPRGVRQLFTVVERSELDRLGVDPAVPLALAAAPGIVLTASTEPPVVGPAGGGAHGYLPELPEMHTGFLGWGAGFRRGAVAPILGLEQIAPLVAHLLDLPFEAPDGALPAGLLTEPDRQREE